MKVDMDVGTLKFWVDGKPHGPGYTSGVTGPLCWAINVFRKGSVEIVPTPELQPWAPPAPEGAAMMAADKQKLAQGGTSEVNTSSVNAQ